MEYGSVTWDNCTQYEKQEFEKFQTEAARIATSTTKLVSLQSLYNETKWDSLEKRRNDHKLSLFFKMMNSLAPLYLSSLIPPTVNSLSRYNLRNSDNLQTIDCRTNQYFQSFLPSTVRAWNNLPPEAKQTDSLNSFKHFLNRDKSYVPKYYYSGKRQLQILHTRLRMNCSSSNYDLYLKNITDSPLCRCGSIKNTYHYFFQCSYYTPQRVLLFDAISGYCEITLRLLLSGYISLSHDTNKNIFQQVQKYISDTKRF